MVVYQSFCTNPIFVQAQIEKKIVQKSLIEPDKNDLDPSKTIWTVQNNFGPSEGQGISKLLKK